VDEVTSNFAKRFGIAEDIKEKLVEYIEVQLSLLRKVDSMQQDTEQISEISEVPEEDI